MNIISTFSQYCVLSWQQQQQRGSWHLMSSNFNWMSAKQKQDDSDSRNVFHIVHTIKCLWVWCAIADMNINQLKITAGDLLYIFIIIINIYVPFSLFSFCSSLMQGARLNTKQFYYAVTWLSHWSHLCDWHRLSLGRVRWETCPQFELHSEGSMQSII